MKVLAYDPTFRRRGPKLGVTLCNSLEEVLREADFVSLHLPSHRRVGVDRERRSWPPEAHQL